MHELSTLFKNKLISSDDIIAIDRHILHAKTELDEKHQAANIVPNDLSDEQCRQFMTEKYLGIIETTRDLHKFFTLLKTAVSENNHKSLANMTTNAKELCDKHGKNHTKLVNFLNLVVSMTQTVLKEKLQYTKSLSTSTTSFFASANTGEPIHPLGPKDLTAFFATAIPRPKQAQKGTDQDEQTIHHPLATDLTAGGG